MQIISPAFGEGEEIPKIYTCDGKNISPPLSFSDVPKDAVTLALIVDDPDAPNGTFTHWILWNIDKRALGMPENGLSQGAQQGLNDTGEEGYTGPCPPSGVHHYHFKLYALDRILTISNDSTKADLERELESGVLEKAQLVGIYKSPHSPT